MNIKKVRENLYVMAFFMALCVFLLIYVIPCQIPIAAAAKNQAFTPQTFPYLLSGGLLFCTIIGLVKYVILYIRLKKTMKEAGQTEEHTRMTKHEFITAGIPYIMYAVIVFYGFLFKAIGFIWATVIVPPILLVILKDKKWYHYAIFYTFAAVMYVIFKVVLKVQLP